MWVKQSRRAAGNGAADEADASAGAATAAATAIKISCKRPATTSFVVMRQRPLKSLKKPIIERRL